MTVVAAAPTDTHLTTLVLDAAIAAARVILDVYARPIVAVDKADGSPVTEADAAAEAIILEHLKPTGIPVLGEESVAAGNIPVLGERYFVVDPLDGPRNSSSAMASSPSILRWSSMARRCWGWCWRRSQARLSWVTRAAPLAATPVRAQ